MIKRWKQFNELHVQSSKVNCINDSVDFDVLTKLEDERNSLVEGDEVIATYFSGGFDTYDFKLERWYEPSTGDYVLGCSSDDKMFTIEDAYHIVKRETYDDFVEPENQLLEKAAPRRRAIPPRDMGPDPNVVLYLSKEIEDAVKAKYTDVIDDLFVDLHQEFNTVSGDADFTTDNLIEDYKGSAGQSIVETTTNQIISNMTLVSMAKSLTSGRISFQVLSELKDERQNVRNGEEVILVTTESIVRFKNRLIKVILGTVHNTDMIKGGNLDYNFDESILIVKRETYEDFAGPLNLTS